MPGSLSKKVCMFEFWGAALPWVATAIAIAVAMTYANAAKKK